MTEREVVVGAVVIAVACAVAWACPVWMWIGMIAIGLVATLRLRRLLGGLVIVALAATASTMASRAESGLVTAPRTVDGWGTMQSDPEAGIGGLSFDVRVEGHRYLARVTTENAGDVRNTLAGTHIKISGRISPLVANWEWRAARHYSGRLTIDKIHASEPGRWWWESANWMHRSTARGAVTMSPQQESLFVGIVFGDDRKQSEVDRFRFRSSGLSHLLAVSGQNIAFLLLVISPLFLRLSLRGRWLLGAVVLGWFLLVTRMEPSVVRACAMAMVVATSAWMGRYVSGLRVLAVAAIACLLVDPLLVWSVGFRLSVGASAALIVLARPLARRIGGPRPIAFLIAASLAAQVGTAPILLTFTDSVPLMGPLFNLAAVPVAGWLMMWGVVSGPLAGLVGDPVASIVGSVSRVMVDWLSLVARVGASPRWPRMGGLGVAAMAVGTIALASWDPACDRWGERRVRRVAVWVLVGAAIVVSLDVSGVLRDEVEVEARGFVLWSDGGVTVLIIDGPPDDRSMLDALLAARSGRVDAVFVIGGGKVSSASVLMLRQVVDVGEVLAVEPTKIRGSIALESGEYSVGKLVLRVTRADDDWSILISP